MTIMNQLTPGLEYAVEHLLTACDGHDQASTCIQMNSGLNDYTQLSSWVFKHIDAQLVGVCHIFSINTFEAEISLAVLPEYRNQGIGEALATKAKCLLKESGYQQLFYVCDENSISGKSFIAKRLASPHHTEITLSFDKFSELPRASRLLVSKAYDRDLDKITLINADAFEDDYEVTGKFIRKSLENTSQTAYIGQLNYKPICTLMLKSEENHYSINGLAVLKEHQGKGYGKELLQEVIHGLKSQGQVLIKVDKESLREYALYKKIGFTESRITSYFIEHL